jgi:hypothetical protein
MKQSNPSNEEVIGQQLVEEISQIQQKSLGEGAAVCQVCGENLGEGRRLTAYAFRPAESHTYQVGHLKCLDDKHEPTEHFTLGVRELVVEGRVGRCTDQATQSSWPVLLAPEPRVVSPADSTDAHPLPGTTWIRRSIARSEYFVAAGDTTADPASKPWQQAAIRADSYAGDRTARAPVRSPTQGGRE